MTSGPRVLPSILFTANVDVVFPLTWKTLLATLSASFSLFATLPCVAFPWAVNMPLKRKTATQNIFTVKFFFPATDQKETGLMFSRKDCLDRYVLEVFPC